MEYATLVKRNRIDGLLVSPDDPNWDAARQAWNLTVDQRPAAVALPDTAQDVADIVESRARPATGSRRRAPATTRIRSAT